MAGEKALIQGVLSVLRARELDWVIADIVESWEASNLPTTAADDDTSLAARQALVLAETIESSLLRQVDAAYYLALRAPDGVWTDPRRPDQQFLGTRVGSAGLADARGMVESFVARVRAAVAEDWPNTGVRE